MKTFTIDAEDNITAFGAGERVGALAPAAERFHSEHELVTLAAKWPANRLVEIWNSLPDVQPVRRFTDRNTAVARIWKAIQGLQPTGAQQAGTGSAKQAESTPKASRGPGPDTGRNTRTAQVMALLERPGGASLKSIMRATGWQAHSVRGFISGHLRKKLGLRVKSFKRNGERVYAIRRRTKSH